MTITLPYPPSVNGLFSTVGNKRVRSPRYVAWAKQAALQIMIQRPAKVLGAYRMTVLAQRPDRRARDLDNMLKPIADALVKAEVITDDSLAESIFIAWSAEAPRKDATVSVEIIPVLAPAQAERVAA